MSQPLRGDGLRGVNIGRPVHLCPAQSHLFRHHHDGERARHIDSQLFNAFLKSKRQGASVNQNGGGIHLFHELCQLFFDGFFPLFFFKKKNSSSFVGDSCPRQRILITLQRVLNVGIDGISCDQGHPTMPSRKQIPCGGLSNLEMLGGSKVDFWIYEKTVDHQKG